VLTREILHPLTDVSQITAPIGVADSCSLTAAAACRKLLG
jgi:hypothetical protein